MTLREALEHLWQSGKLRAPWLDGMRYKSHLNEYDMWWAPPIRLHQGSMDPPEKWEPDIDDPATVGCLLAQLEEATGYRWWVELDEDDDYHARVEHKGVLAGAGRYCRYGSTRGDAILQSIIVMAEAA